jgi:hypothetical protein
VDTDLWLCVLDLAAVRGWSPPRADSQERSAGTAFTNPAGLQIDAPRAQELAGFIEALLPTISEKELPLSNHPFGEEHTEALLKRRAAGEELTADDASAAQELLSGAPKKEVELLAKFLKAGSVSIEAA